MPRKPLEIDLQLEELSILAEDGSVDEDLLPELDADLQRKIHRTMLLSRRFDERLLTLQKQGRIGTFAPAIGQEAAQVGAAACMSEQDWLAPSYRDSAAGIWRGTPLSGVMLYDAGWNEGAAVAEDARDLPSCVPVASQIPHAAGLAYAAKLQQTGEAVLVFFGDGATSEGDFHEALNFAGVHDLPVVFACQNNQYAISTPLELQTQAGTIVQKAVAYGISGIRVDGNDVLAVQVAFAEAFARAREGQGPTLVEAVTYRLSVHTTADDPSVYREDEEVERWRERDPIPRFQRFLIEREMLSEEDIESLEEEIEQEIDEAWKEAERQMKSFDLRGPMFEHILEEIPPYLEAQRQGQLQSSRQSPRQEEDHA